MPLLAVVLEFTYIPHTTTFVHTSSYCIIDVLIVPVFASLHQSVVGSVGVCHRFAPERQAIGTNGGNGLPSALCIHHVPNKMRGICVLKKWRS